MMKIRYYGSSVNTGIMIPYKNTSEILGVSIINDIVVLPENFIWSIEILNDVVMFINKVEDGFEVDGHPVVTVNGPDGVPPISWFGYPEWMDDLMDYGIDKLWSFYGALKCIKYEPGAEYVSKIMTLFVYSYIVNDNDEDNMEICEKIRGYLEDEFNELWRNN
jgi:hypothetical protein